jgi:hypothetical protein
MADPRAMTLTAFTGDGHENDLASAQMTFGVAKDVLCSPLALWMTPFIYSERCINAFGLADVRFMT